MGRLLWFHFSNVYDSMNEFLIDFAVYETLAQEAVQLQALLR